MTNLPYAVQISIAILLVLVAAAMVWSLLRDVVLGMASRRWPCVTGRLTELVHDHDEDNHAHRVDVRYHYEVAGRHHEGSRLRFDMRISTGRKAALKLMAQGTQGGAVRVYHSPSRPQLSVLRPGLTWQLLYGLAFTAFVVMLAWNTAARVIG